MAGAEKSTFSRVLSTKTGLPVICLDLHSWNPGWILSCPRVVMNHSRNGSETNGDFTDCV